MIRHVTPFQGLLVLEQEKHNDDRGGLLESYRESTLQDLGPFVQDVHSWSKFKVVRGLHYQVGPHAQAKLVRCISGSIIDIAVDLRVGSATFGRFFSTGLQGPLCNGSYFQVYIPVGFAHGFSAVAPDLESYANNHVSYKITDYHSSDHERGIRWDDPDLGINWFGLIVPSYVSAIVSEKDRKAESWFDYCRHPAFELRDGQTICL